MTFLARAIIFSEIERVSDWAWVADVNRGTTAQHPQENQLRDATSTGKAATSKRSSKGTEQQQKWGGSNRATDKHNYTHPWLLTSLKGHTGQVYDMDFSSNGKYLASCADGEYATSTTLIITLLIFIYLYVYYAAT